MVPNSFVSYFMAMAGAGGALIGLLFVAISISPERIFGRQARVQRQAVAANAFSAMVNAFFISAAALIPGKGVLGPTTLVMASLGILSALSLAFRAIRVEQGRGHHWFSLRPVLLMIGAGIAAYAYETDNAIALVRDPRDVGAVFALAWLVLVVYAIGLVRAWELLGAPRAGLSAWLNPLRELEGDEEVAGAGPEANGETLGNPESSRLQSKEHLDNKTVQTGPECDGHANGKTGHRASV